MPDFYDVHQKMTKTTQVTLEQMTAAYSVIGTQPRQEWSMFVKMLGLDGAHVHLNSQAKSRKSSVEAA